MSPSLLSYSGSWENIARRRQGEPALDDFLSWNAGTLEYGVHVLAYGVARAEGWAAQTEVAYITGCPNPSSKSNVKWADGAFLFPDSVGVVLEVKTVLAHGQFGPIIAKVPADMAALLSADWPATLLQMPDGYASQVWREKRAKMKGGMGPSTRSRPRQVVT